MTAARTVRLGDVVEVKVGFASGKKLTDGVLQVRMNNVTEDGHLDFSSQRRVPVDLKKLADLQALPGDVLFNATNAPGLVGKTATFRGRGEPVVYSNHFFRLRPLSTVDGLYLGHLLAWHYKQGTFRLMCRQWVNQASINRDQLMDLAIPLPSLGEQRRIAGILDAADGLRAKRRESIALLDTLTQSTFLDMFGDGGGYAWVPFGQVCNRLTVGVVVKPASYYVEDGVPALRTLNVKPGYFDLSDLVRFSSDANDGPLSKSKLLAGDLVIARTGRPGTTAVVPVELDGANAIDLLVVTPDKEVVLSTYLEVLMNSPVIGRMVQGQKRGQIQQHFNAGSLRAAPIPVPPLDEQTVLTARIMYVRSLRDRALAHLAESEALFASLQSRAFRGEL